MFDNVDLKSEIRINDVLINEQITIPEVMVIGPNGEKMGIKKIEDAQTRKEYAAKNPEYAH